MAYYRISVECVLGFASENNEIYRQPLPLLICLLNASSGAASDKKQISAALAAVEENLKTLAGKQYDAAIGGQFPQKYAAAIRQCKQKTPSSSLDPFDLFLKLRSDGKVEEALAYPETTMAVCARDAMSAANSVHRPGPIPGSIST